MRLLNAKTRRLENFSVGNRPECAILSHTWGEQEVSFQDVEAASPPTHKLGYQKIVWTCDEALQRGLTHAWVDTCCIDKTSTTELSEAINSMYQWYQDSALCFAYLSDVPLSPENQEVQTQAFARSRWFKRGWTLQELLAPKMLTFFSDTWAHLGDRSSFATTITDTTRIDAKFLQGDAENYFNEASVAEKMDWASTRETTKIEDMAYCLLGIFGINMPLLYGEGSKAFIRLQEELIRNSGDQSIFAWGHTGSSDASPVPGHLPGILAESPTAFYGCSRIESRGAAVDREPFSLTNVGISIKAPIKWLDGSRYSMMLRCGPKDDPTNVLVLPLWRARDKGEWHFRRQDCPTTNPYSVCMYWRSRSISLLAHRNVSLGRPYVEKTPVWIETISPRYYMTEFHPAECWSPSGRLTRLRDVYWPSNTRSFCTITNRHNGANVTLLFINGASTNFTTKWLGNQLRTWQANRIRCTLLPSAADPETCESGPSHYTWQDTGVFMFIKTRYQPTPDGSLLTVVSIDDTSSVVRRVCVLVQQACQNYMAGPLDTVEIVTQHLTGNLQVFSTAIDTGELGLNVALCFRAYMGMPPTGYPYQPDLGWELACPGDNDARKLRQGFGLVLFLVVFGGMHWSLRDRYRMIVFWPRPLLLLLTVDALFLFHHHVWTDPIFSSFLGLLLYLWGLLDLVVDVRGKSGLELLSVPLGPYFLTVAASVFWFSFPLFNPRT